MRGLKLGPSGFGPRGAASWEERAVPSHPQMCPKGTGHARVEGGCGKWGHVRCDLGYPPFFLIPRPPLLPFQPQAPTQGA